MENKANGIFPIEQTLIDILGFSSKLVKTFLYSFYCPYVIFAKYTRKERVDQILPSYLYFIICIVLAIPPLITYEFARINNLSITTSDVLLESYQNITNISFPKNLFLLILPIFLFAGLLKAISLIANKLYSEKVRFIWDIVRKTGFYFSGTTFLVFLLFKVFKKDWDTAFIFLNTGYWILGYIWSVKKWHSNKEYQPSFSPANQKQYIRLLGAILSGYFLFVAYVVPNGFKKAIQYQLECFKLNRYQPEVSILSRELNDTLIIHKFSDSSGTRLQLALWLTNNSDKNKYLFNNDILCFDIKQAINQSEILDNSVNKFPQQQLNLSFYSIDTSAEKDKPIMLSAGESRLIQLKSIPADSALISILEGGKLKEIALRTNNTPKKSIESTYCQYLYFKFK